MEGGGKMEAKERGNELTHFVFSYFGSYISPVILVHIFNIG